MPLQISMYLATTLLDKCASLHQFNSLNACPKEIQLSGSARLGEPQLWKMDSRKKLIKLLLTSLETVTQTKILD